VRTLLLILSVLALLVAALLIVMTAVRLRSAMIKHEKLQWVEDELERAIAQLQSGDEEKILVALQMLAALNDVEARLRALPYISALRGSSIVRVARQAGVTEQRVIAGLRIPSIRSHEHRKRATA